MKNVFKQADVNELLSRLDQLSTTTQPLWGTMSVGQMLAHCNVTYEMVYENTHSKPNFLVRFLLKVFIKPNIVNEKPYKQNLQTASQFIIKETKNFAQEKARLQAYIFQTLQHGEDYFEGKESLSFGVLNKTEWNNLFYKHLDHHFRQFGV